MAVFELWEAKRRVWNLFSRGDRCGAFFHHGGAFGHGDQDVVLVKCAVDEIDNALRGAGLAFALALDFGGDMNGVAVENRMGKPGFAHAEIADGCAERRVGHRYADHQPQGKNRVDQWFAKFCFGGKVEINMQGLRV